MALASALARARWIWIGGLAIAAAAGAGYFYVQRGDPPPKYRLAKVERGPIVSTITATGTVNPVVSVVVGSQLSGQIVELKADFNTQVKADQELARLDIEQIDARLLSARADLAAARAQVESQKAQIERAAAEIENIQAALSTAESDAVRKESLARGGIGPVAESERARNAAISARAALRSAEASLKVAKAQLLNLEASVQQREAAVVQVEVDIKRSVIRSPIDGVVVQRNVDVGQTVAASLQSPVLFTIAQDLRKMEVHTTVDEADIGRVRPGMEVGFTVNAYPNERFPGRVAQVRLAPINIQNVITYTVVISADNGQLKLLPGMTATVTITTDKRDDVLKVVNAALRYRPPGRAAVASAAPAAGGEGPAAGGGGQAAGGGGQTGGGDARARAEALKKALVEGLSLDQAQREELDRIFAQSGAETRALFTGGAPPEERRAKLAQIREAATRRIDAMLTAEQKPKYAAMRAAQAGGAPGELHVVGPDGLPRTLRVRLGATDGNVTEVSGPDVKPGLEVIVGGGPRAAAAPPPAARLLIRRGRAWATSGR
ncbi:MAG: HlyD family secretion protein [Rhodospirillales bacterium]|nr:MAG: HlyD family secretion protein [Rhodospirillales bacterium]